MADQTQASEWPLVVTGVMVVISDPGSLDLDDTIALVAAQTTQISMALVVAYPSDTNKATGCDPDPETPCG